MFATKLYARTLQGDIPPSFQCHPDDPAPGDAEFANALFQGRFVFLGEQRSALNEPPWSLKGTSEAWQAEVNAFEWLADFRATEAETARLRARDLVRSWIDVNSQWQPVSWRSDILGRRLASWACHGGFLCDGAEPTFRRSFLTSFAAQARHLSRTMGIVSNGVWVLPAVVGRVIAGIVLGDESKRLNSDLTVLQRQIATEILPDGTQASHNVSQAIAALRLLLIVRSGLESIGWEVPDVINDAIRRIALSSKSFRHGDGCFGIFNGSTECDRAYLDAILAAAKARGTTASTLTDGGLHRISAGRSLILFDVGAADIRTGSVYAGLLSFELSVGRDRVIVNCGTGGGSQWHQVGRTTAAHSTLTIADTNIRDISEVGPHRPVTPITSATRREEGGNVLIEASHESYAGRFGLRHDRAIYMSPDGGEIRGEDAIVAINQIGEQTYPYAIRFHLHPQINASLASDGVTVLLRLPHGAGMRFRASTPVSLEESVYLGSAAGARSTQQAVIYGNTKPNDPTTVKWALTLYQR